MIQIQTVIKIGYLWVISFTATGQYIMAVLSHYIVYAPAFQHPLTAQYVFQTEYMARLLSMVVFVVDFAESVFKMRIHYDPGFGYALDPPCGIFHHAAIESLTAMFRGWAHICSI
jgi:hypothetical protein